MFMICGTCGQIYHGSESHSSNDLIVKRDRPRLLSTIHILLLTDELHQCEHPRDSGLSVGILQLRGLSLAVTLATGLFPVDWPTGTGL
jgi:hypothetical protein